MLEDREQRAHFLKIIGRNAAHLTNLLENIGTLTALERTPGVEVEKVVAVATVFRRVAEPLTGEAEQQGVRLEADYPLPDLAVDRAALEFVLTNLLINAIRYSHQARSDRYVRVCAHAGRGCWDARDQVEDNGMGIPEEARDHVFDQFYRAGSARRVPGTGLGLAIVKEAVKRWGGVSGSSRKRTWARASTSRPLQPRRPPSKCR